MSHVFNSHAVAYRTTAAQLEIMARTARTEVELARDLNMPRWQLRLLRWQGCAPAAIRVDGQVYYTFGDIAQWRRRFH